MDMQNELLLEWQETSYLSCQANNQITRRKLVVLCKHRSQLQCKLLLFARMKQLYFTSHPHICILYCVKVASVRLSYHSRLYFNLSLTFLRWIKVQRVNCQQDQITLRGSHAITYGETHVEGVIDYLHTRIGSSTITSHTRHASN